MKIETTDTVETIVQITLLKEITLITAFPFDDANIKESENRLNIGDLCLLAARDMLREHTHKEFNLLLALKTYADIEGDDVITFDELMQWIEKDVRFMHDNHGAYSWWDGQLFTQWLSRSSLWDQIGALVDAYYGSY